MSETPKQSKIHPRYAFSTDYTRLLKLITGGHEIMCRAEYYRGYPDPCRARHMGGRFGYQISCRGIGYVDATTPEEFVEHCQGMRVQFLDPDTGKNEVDRLRADVAEMNSALADLIDERHDLNQEVAELRFQADHLRSKLAEGTHWGAAAHVVAQDSEAENEWMREALDKIRGHALVDGTVSARWRVEYIDSIIGPEKTESEEKLWRKILESQDRVYAKNPFFVGNKQGEQS